MEKIDIKLPVDEVNVKITRNQRIELSIDGVYKTDLLEPLNVNDAIDFFGEDAFLKAIGESSAINYFNLQLR